MYTAPYLLLLSLLFIVALSACPRPPPPLQTNVVVRTRRFAQIPDELGSPANIISIKTIPGSSDLAICTLLKIYRVSQSGSPSLFLDVEKAFRANGRDLNYLNKAHGGLRAVAFHPNYRRNGLFYVSAMEDRPSNPKSFRYISDARVPIPADGVVVEFTTRGGKPDAGSYRLLFRVGMPVYDHPIKQIEFFGGLLYVSHGDGSVQSATAGGGQKNDALGKILRIDPLKRGQQSYTVPKSNPFPNRSRPKMPREVFAYGFRNPHHLCFSRSGVLYAADTGRDNFEEVNIVRAGRNYGWSEREGTCVHLKSGGGIGRGVRELPADDAKFGYVYPVAQYAHAGIKGGTFVGTAIAGSCPIENRSFMSGRYWYADFPSTGKLYFSELRDMLRARTTGAPNRLTQARTKQAKIWYEGKVYDTLMDVLRSNRGFNSGRADVRFGRGSKGELYWSSKRDGRLYLFTSSLVGAKV